MAAAPSPSKVPASELLPGVLEACSLFNGIPSETIAELAGRMNTFSVARGRVFIEQGDTSADAYVLISGRAMGQLVSSAGREVLFTDIAEGGYFGELAALDGEERSITISARTDCVVAAIPEETFMDMLHEFPQIAVNLATDLALRVRHMNERLFGMIMHDVESRVRNYLMQLAQEQEQLVNDGEITDAPTHESMANYIGANREAVSRAMARLNKSGVIETARKRIVIRDLDALRSGEIG